ncbi:MAG: HAMP domain-containing protein [Phycisphaerae bacterium]|nr:HAMP domain-containing protein [Phycisphaerae bacterium]
MGRPSTLFWKLFLGTTFLIVAVLVICTWQIVGQVDRLLGDQMAEHLRLQAMTIGSAVCDRFDPAHAEELNRLTKELGRGAQNELRVTLILRDGRVLADSMADPSTMDSHAHRKEVVQALATGLGEDTHRSRTIDRPMRYTASRVGPADAPLGVVRVSMAIQTIGQREGTIHRLIWTIVLLGLVAAAAFAMGLARLWSRPISRITAMARSLARGDLSTRVPVESHDEMGMLARSMNEMGNNLAEQLSMIDRQRRTLESLLTQLREGVIVAGADGRILLMNPAAMRMLGLAARAAAWPESLVGRPVEQCILHHDLQQMLLQSLHGQLEAGGTAEGHASTTTRKISVHRGEEDGALVLLATASDIVLPDPGQAPGGSSEGQTLGRIVLLADITELNRMVRVRTDFAANASHELRTPLSAIRGAVETLTGLDWAKDPEAARQFLGMIDRQSNRMLLMVSDLLDLSRIESSPGQYKPQELNLPAVLAELRSRFEERLVEKDLHWVVDLAPGLRSVNASPHLLRCIIDNLVDNAVKFTDPGGRISVTCRCLAAESGKATAVSIEVEDTGCGIAEDEQDRVFERFYQVERARTGPDRGTGLGLSIVRHAVAAMNGSVTLRSKLGEGTCITVIIPQGS